MAIRYVSSQGKSESPIKRQLDIQPNEGLLSSALRGISGIGAKAIEAIGAPLSSIQNIGRLGQQEIASGFEKSGMPGLAQISKEPTPLGKAFEKVAPTTENIKKYGTQPVAEAITGQKDYLKPQGPISEFLQDTAYTASAIFNPLAHLGIPYTGGKEVSLLGSTGRAVSGQALRTATRIFGGGEKAQNIADFIGMTAAGTAGTRKDLLKKADLDFKLVEEKAPKFSARPIKLKRKMGHASEKLKLADIPKDAKDFLNDRYSSILEELNTSDKFNTGRAVERYREVNDWLRNSETPGRAKKGLENIREGLREFIQESGKRSPEFIKAFNESNEIYAAAQSLQNLQQFLQKHIPLPQLQNSSAKKFMEFLLAPAAYGIGATGLGLIGGVKGLAIAAGAGTAGRQLYKTYKFIQKSPVAQTAYLDMLSAAANQNAPAVIANAKKLDEEITKEEKKEFESNHKKGKSQGITYRKARGS